MLIGSERFRTGVQLKEFGNCPAYKFWAGPKTGLVIGPQDMISAPADATGESNI